ncbi:DUF4476 domain-containing protein [Comamonas sp. JC664]|uniref:DUF4476 domain-containing protein n=1 Tax=Comamonas sp. JC664 TaxID=2801917 RepID=UPI00174D412D|nr:DUF4476 domain-containing protein [Comamonas sp. JC664]MBL0695714.1 DUF4476 domain-containing protein [Comamonas sp. JC664]GHG63098.1 hypothetical protein GCM10012319_02360 [Comamonas sp. KCTC 72670]
MKALITSLALLFALPALDAHAQADMRRPPGPPPGQPQPHRPNPHAGNQVVVDRDELRQRLARLEKQLQEAEQRMNREERNKFRKTRELLNSVQQLVNEAPPLAVVLPPPPPPAPMPPPPPQVRPISEGELRRINESISRHSFNEDKMRVLNSATQNNYFLVSQVGQLLGHFQFSQDKLAVVRLLKPAILDMQNSHQLYSHFNFSSDKKKLEEILSQR